MGGNKSDVSVSEVVRPTVGRIVHYVASSQLIPDLTGKTHPDVRAMLITAVAEDLDGILVNGQVFRAGTGDTVILQQILEVSGIPNDELEMKSGTWHWPSRAPRS